MRRLVLHIGQGKCASSTVQGYLSRFPLLPLDGRQGGTLRYVVANPNHTILHGEALAVANAAEPLGHLVSHADLLRDMAAMRSCIDQIRRITRPDDVVMMSCEGWSVPRSLAPDVAEFLNGMPFAIDLFMLSRPPVERLNAAWWQWGAWMGVGLETALERLGRRNFLRSLDQWKMVRIVDRIAVRDVSQDPIACLLDFVGTSDAAPKWNERINAASDYDLLRHLIKNQDHYGRSQHNPVVEFRLNALISGERRPLPFVVSRKLAQDLVLRDLDDNRKLVDLMRNDRFPLRPEVERRYLDPAAYDHLPDHVDLSEELAADYSDDFVGKLVEAILSLEREVSAHSALMDAVANFDPNRYLELSPDVRKVRANPYEHLLRHGIRERRRLR